MVIPAVKSARICVAAFLLMLAPALVLAQPEPEKVAPPPVAQQLVREGDLALRLVAAIGLGAVDDETEAESRLGEAGIAPRNGWIADYPVTPDIVAELYAAVGDAADKKKIPLGRENALKRLEEATTQSSVPVKPYDAATAYKPAPPEEAEQYPNPAVINNYYYNEGPPVVTYYAPPPDYYYLYSWVPSPFWCVGFWFPGFFILHDFHRTVYIGNRVRYVSNHFRDLGAQRVFRIDPVRRFNGRTYAGIGVSSRKGFVSTGIARSNRRIFNAPPTRTSYGVRTGSQSRGGRSSSLAPAAGRSMSPAARTGRMASPPSRGGMVTPPSRGAASPPSRGIASPPSHGIPVRGGGGMSGRGERR